MPRCIGTLRLLRETQGVSLQYRDDWIAQGVALSEDLPLLDLEFMPPGREEAAGAVDDARPDRWGERVIRLLDRPPRLSVLEFLYFAGDNRTGALGVSLHADRFEPHRTPPLPAFADVDAIAALARRVQSGDPIADERERRLLAPGATMGGARPKGVVIADGVEWMVKFAEFGVDTVDEPLVEHATLTLAERAGIVVAASRPVALATGGHALAIRRFDRKAGSRLHLQSARVALRAEGSEYGYPEFAQLLRRRADAREGLAFAQMRELYRRMLFNIFIDNTDDHEKNHALLMDQSTRWSLAPAFDVVPTLHSLGVQAMRVGREGGASTLHNALSDARQFGLDPRQARMEASAVARVVAGWRTHFAANGVTEADLETLARGLDRPFLLEQRAAALSDETGS
ncbi:MAG: HipA domain-containing protein [Proteobacteria bacterium]|nr:HipA domain-containing protein [Pseudomonadota bacterium]